MEKFKLRADPLIQIVGGKVEDRLSIRSRLEGAGFRVAEAEVGTGATVQFKALLPDMVLLDESVVSTDGFCVCRAIRGTPGCRNVPIFILSEPGNRDVIRNAFVAGVTDVINKPINWPVFNNRVRYMLRASDAFTAVINKQRKIQDLTFLDPLTGLANRSMFMTALEKCLVNDSAESKQLSVMLMDLDHFKNINSSLGHHVGDGLLKNAADRICACIREAQYVVPLQAHAFNTFISRLGGDEFGIIFSKTDSAAVVSSVARKINEALARPFFVDGNEIFISVSIGVSVFPQDGDAAKTLVKYAELAMYSAKDKGKNAFKFYEKKLAFKAKERLTFEGYVRKAVLSEEFSVHYQPQVCLQSGKIIGAECLARWNHPILERISPETFIPMIEDLGLIAPFTDWVIRQVSQQHLVWKKEGVKQVRVAVNVSNKNFVSQLLPDKVGKAFQTNNLNPEVLEIELTESVLAERDEATLNILKLLRKMGVPIAVDDFGTGYSSLACLKIFPIDRIKIDRFFIRDILTSVQDAAIVKAIIAMAHSSEKTVVAEGVESREQLRLLKAMGCDVGQGFFFSPAVSGAAFAQLLRDERVLAA